MGAGDHVEPVRLDIPLLELYYQLEQVAVYPDLHEGAQALTTNGVCMIA